MTARPSEERALLIGMMGVGKSTLGAALSTATGWPYLDSDALVHLATGATTRQVLDTGGENALREAESKALRRALDEPAPVVAGVAAGVVEVPEDVATLADADALVVWLRAPIEELVRRVGIGADRPWLQPDPAAALRELAVGRDPVYERVADLTLDTAAQATDACVSRVLAALGVIAG
jgi:shikimate kinase